MYPHKFPQERQHDGIEDFTFTIILFFYYVYLDDMANNILQNKMSRRKRGIDVCFCY